MSVFGRRQENIHLYSADGSIEVVFVEGDKLSKMVKGNKTNRLPQAILDRFLTCPVPPLNRS
jgi:hypothetical protein